VKKGSDASASDQARTLRVLIELTQSLVSSLDLQEILYTMVSRLADVVQVDRVSIVLVPDDSDVGYVVAASDDAGLTNLQLELSKYPEIRHVLKTRAALTINDVLTHPVLDSVRSSVTDAGHGSLSLLPIMWEQQVMGVLFIRAAAHAGADAEHLDLCQVLANATAIALRNARMMQSLHDETARDAQKRREAEERIDTLKRYADLLASSVDGVVAFDARGLLIFGNPGAYALTGYAQGELPTDATLGNVVAPEGSEELDQLKQNIRAGNYPHNVDVPVVKKSGETMIVNGSFSALKGTQGAVLFSFRDVTEERRTGVELFKNHNFMKSLIDASVDAIVAANMQGQIVVFNEGAQRLYARSQEDAINMNTRALYPGDGAREVMRMLRGEAHGGAGRLEPVRMEAVNADGVIFPISLTAAFIYEDGVPTHTFGIFTDLRERIRVEEQLAQAHEQLAISEKQSLLAELAGATAHELNQPLTSIMGYCELLQRLIDDNPKTEKAAGMILGEAQRMADIVKKIGQLTEYETKSYVGGQKIIDLDPTRHSTPPSGAPPAPTATPTADDPAGGKPRP